MLDEAAVGGGEAQRHAAAGVAIDALVGEVQTRAVTLEQRPQRVPRKRLAYVRPAPDFQNRRHGMDLTRPPIPLAHACETRDEQLNASLMSLSDELIQVVTDDLQGQGDTTSTLFDRVQNEG